jgi:hypothetical protein
MELGCPNARFGRIATSVCQRVDVYLVSGQIDEAPTGFTLERGGVAVGRALRPSVAAAVKIDAQPSSDHQEPRREARLLVSDIYAKATTLTLAECLEEERVRVHRPIVARGGGSGNLEEQWAVRRDEPLPRQLGRWLTVSVKELRER